MWSGTAFRRAGTSTHDDAVLLLIYTGGEAEAAFQSRPPESRYQPWIAYTQALREAGAMVAGNELAPPATATSVRVRQGQRQVQDGPHAETKEMLGGYYIMEAPDLDRALDWAPRCPAAEYGTVELRPLGGM